MLYYIMLFYFYQGVGTIILSCHYTYNIYATDVNAKLIIPVTMLFDIYLLNELNNMKLSSAVEISSLYQYIENKFDISSMKRNSAMHGTYNT